MGYYSPLDNRRQRNWKAILGCWWTALVVVQLILFLASSRAECGGSALAHAPLHLLVAAWSFIAVVLAAACSTESMMWFEAKPNDGDPHRPWYKPASGWFLMSLTIVNITDICTDSLTVGVMVATHSCEGSGIDDAWRQVVSQSWLPCFIPLWSLALAAWMTTAGQFVAALFVGCNEPSSSAIAEVADLLGFEIVYQCIAYPNFNDGPGDGEHSPIPSSPESDPNPSAAPMIAQDRESSGIGQCRYAARSLTLHEQEFAEDTGEPSSGKECDSSEWHAEDGRVAKFILRTLLENCMQLHVQITTAALSVALTGWQQGSILMMIFAASALCSMAYALADVKLMVKYAFKAKSPVTVVVIWTSVFAAIFLFGYAVAKFGGVFYCDYAAMNLSGCVVLDF